MNEQPAVPWAGDVLTWGKQRAYSWWLEENLPAVLLNRRVMFATHPLVTELLDALQAVRELHTAKRHYPTVGCEAWCAACTTGIVSHYDDGSFTHRVTWPCPTIVGIATALGVGPR